MVSRNIQIITFIVFCTTLATAQHVAQGYLNFNAAAGAVGSGSENTKNFGKAYSVNEGKSGALVEGDVETVVAPVVKTVESVPPPSTVHSSLYVEKNIQPIQPVHPVVIEKEIPHDVVYVRKLRPHQRRKYAYVQANVDVPPPPRTSFLTKLLTVGPAPPVPAPAPNSQETVVYVDKQVPPPTGTYVATAQVNKNGQLFNDIFNIPISTLQAVNNLVNNIISGTSVAVTKTVHAQVPKPVEPATVNVQASGYVHP